MTLATARVARERTLSTLVRNLFAIEGAGAGEARKRAEQALLRANPHLADPSALRSGVVVVIPADVSFPTTDRVTHRGVGVSDLLRDTADRLDLAQALATAGLKAEVEDADSYLQRLGDERFRRTISAQVPQAARWIDAAREAQTERISIASTRSEALTAAVAEAHEALERMLARVERP